MDKTCFCTLFTYTFWANRQVWDCVMTLTDAQFDEPLDYSVGSIHVQCVHMMAVEYWWSYFIQHGEAAALGRSRPPGSCVGSAASGFQPQHRSPRSNSLWIAPAGS
ncbi:MAG: DinB family protein [Anaerolineae bacterium]|nr:DinB family protein [Anaerolineae bacterium]